MATIERVSFFGSNGPGVVSATGVLVGDQVLSVAYKNDDGPVVSNLVNGIIRADDEIYFTAVWGDYSAVEFYAVLYRP